MTQEEVFRVWAPEGNVWSPWVSPVVFAQIHCSEGEVAAAKENVLWAHWVDAATALVLDLPSAESIHAAMTLLERGFWPIPTFNASPGPELTSLNLDPSSTIHTKSPCLVDMREIVRAICGATPALSRMSHTSKYCPAFLLDSLRLAPFKVPEPGLFDNRWMTIPEDYPSAKFLQAQGIRRVLLIQQDSVTPANDLAHVLLRWQQERLEIFAKRMDDERQPEAIVVKRPSWFRSSWYRTLVRLGFRRNSVGGFGSYIPEPGSGGGG